jgi:phytoene desaturase
LKKAIIIGSGIAGIATAIRLQKQNFSVEIFEANSYAGGKLSEIRQDGFRFDAGPSLFTMPHFVEELFELHGKKITETFDYEQLPIVCQYFYEDGTRLNAFSDAGDFKQEMIDKLGESEKSLSKFFKKAKDLYQITNHVFLEKSLHKLSTFLNWETAKSIMQLHKLDAFRTMNQSNKARFQNPKTVQLFNRYATYNGSNPYEAPATLNIISHLEHDIGAFFPKKGMHQITKSLVDLAKEVGVKFHYGKRVSEILVENKQAKGIRVGEKEILADLVVSNMDMVGTYQKLLAKQKQPEKMLNQPKSSSALIFYWGMDKEFPELDLHNIFFSEEYETEFDNIFQHRTIYRDPTVYVFISSKQVKTDAPEGKENWFVMINTPNNSGQDWDSLIAEAKQNILSKLNRILGKDLEKHILCEQILDPRTIESRTSSSQGALYGNSSNNKFAAFLRHPNFSQKIENLYFCGGSVHPGGGIPLCLLSAKIVADLVEKDF